MLSILLVHAGESVSTERLIEELWGEGPPVAARKTVQAHVAHLRKTLNINGEVLVSAENGYRIRVDRGSVDVSRFEEMVEEGRSLRPREPGRAAAKLEEALGLFRGAPLSGIADDAFSLRVEASRIEELRLATVEDRLDARLAAGDVGEVIVEAERGVAEHPLRERLWALLMLAQYRAGRQGDALRAFSRVRQVLAEELGIEPSPELETLEQRILDQDTTLTEIAPVDVVSAAVGAPSVRNPYKGLRAFDEADAPDFFGRDELVRRLMERLESRGRGQLVVLAGPSGAGKSSAVRAGLMSELRHHGGEVTLMLPGSDPLGGLARATAEVSHESPREVSSRLDAGHPIVDSPLIVVVDQFEELFTMADTDDVDRFLGLLSERSGPVRWVVTVRADFLDRLLSHPLLGSRLEEALILVPPLQEHEVSAAVIKPARRVGLEVEPELVSEIVRDVRTRPAALPLLQYALTDTFERRRKDVLTLADYRRAGGITGALSRRADELYESSDKMRRDAVRQLLLSLVSVTEEGGEVRRRVDRVTLMSLPVDEVALQAVIERLGEQRLLTFDQDPETGQATVEMAHEALISEWPRLARWVEDGREDLRLRERLAASVREWEGSGREHDFLLRGARLTEMETLVAGSRLDLTGTEREFLAMSRQVEDAEQRRQRRRRRVITAILTAAAIIAAISAVVAFLQANDAREAARLATARELAAAAVANLEEDPELSALLAIEAIETTRSADGTVLPEAEEALHHAVQADRLQLQALSAGAAFFSPDGERFVGGGIDDAQIRDTTSGEVLLTLVGHTAPVFNAVYSADGTLLATNSRDGTTRIWDASTGDELHRFDGDREGPPLSVAISPDSALVATSHATAVVVWELATGEIVTTLQVPNPLGINFGPGGWLAVAASTSGRIPAFESVVEVWDVFSSQRVATLPTERRGATDVAFSPDGSFLVVGDDPTVRVYDTDTWELRHRMHGHNDSVQAVDVDSSGTLIASGSADGTARIFDAETGDPLLTIAAHRGAVINVAFNSGGTLLATGGSDDTIRIWDITPTTGAEWLVFAAPSNDVDYSPDGTRLAASAFDGGIWNAFTGDLIAPIEGHQALVRRIQFSPDGDSVATASFDGTAGLWDASTGVQQRILGHLEGVGAVDFSPDGTRLATASDIITIWDTASGDQVLSRTVPTMGPTDVEFSPDGERFATSGWDGFLKLWDADTGDLIWEQEAHSGFDPTVIQLDFSDDGAILATASWDGTAKVWDADTGDEIWTLEGHVGEVWAVDFSPDGTVLATGGADGALKLWDLSRGVERLTLATVPQTVLFAVEFSPDGTRLATGSFGDTIRVYAVDINDLVDIARTRLSRPFTDGECRTYLHTEECPTAPEGLDVGDG